MDNNITTSELLWGLIEILYIKQLELAWHIVALIKILVIKILVTEVIITQCAKCYGYSGKTWYFIELLMDKLAINREWHPERIDIKKAWKLILDLAHPKSYKTTVV